MSSESKMAWETTKHLANDLVFKYTGKFLSDIEVEVLQGSWEGNNYEYIAEKTRRSFSYINTNVGNCLWKKLSEALGEEVSKRNFRQALKREWERTNISANSTTSEFPCGPVALDSPFYVERPPIEADGYREILKPGSVIRIKAPSRMGKTSLLNRILANAASQNYQTVRINLRQAEKTLFTNLDKFLRWFCCNVSRGLNLEPRLDDYWDEDSGSKVSCTEYFERHLLSQVSSNLVIGLDEIDSVFSYPDIAEDFLGLLREFHEEAMIKDNWPRLRLVMAYSTEVYIPLNINQSPFNVGLPLKLPLFDQQQVQDLAVLHGLAWASGESAQKLIAMVGGHPYLVQLALYHLSRQEVTLEHLLQDAPTHAGIYSDHLRHCLGHLQQQPELAAVLKQVVTADNSVQLQSVQVYQLDSMGLVQLDGNYVQPSCELYRQYFCTNL